MDCRDVLKPMNKSNRNLIYFGGGVLALWFLYLERAILAPFILAAIFAYILNPLVNLLTHKIRLPRSISIVFVYLLLVITFGGGLVWIGAKLAHESLQLERESQGLVRDLDVQISHLPDFIQGFAQDTVESLRESTAVAPQKALPFFSGAVSRLVYLFVFLISMFYFLKDGGRAINKFINFIPETNRAETVDLLNKINKVVGNYLRGQLVLVLIMSSLTFIALTIIGVRYALLISIFTGFAEIVPFVGPLVAGAVAVTVAVLDGLSRYGWPPLYEASIVAAVYFLLRQFEDYFIIPHIMSRITKLHPLLVLFAVLAGGHLYGALGLLLAVPVAATVRILLQYGLEKMDLL